MNVETDFTEGAIRAIRRAEHFAVHHSADELQTVHLLWSLLTEESRALEILTAHGVSIAAFCEEFAIAGDSTAWQQLANDPPAEQPAKHITITDVLFQSRRHAGLSGRYAEISTEHLLQGLVDVDSAVADFLRGHGLSSGALSEMIVAASGFTAEPIDVDIQIAGREPTTADFTDTYRVLDAAANRAREGLRVVEDFVRFSLDDALLMAKLKNVRHQLAQVLGRFDSNALLTARDTQHDVGTSVHTTREMSRSSPLDIVRANLKRAEESLRTLEEYAKVLSAVAAEELGQLRYEMYTIEKVVLLTAANRRNFEGRNLYLLATEELCLQGSGPAIRAALSAGVSIVQVREKTLPDRELLQHAERVREWTKEAGALFIMNDRPDLAVLADADGVHVGQEELHVRDARRIVGPDRIVGVSTHTIEQARQAVIDGADYLGVGPVFATSTKQFDNLAGLEFVRQVAEEITLPWFAIGGIQTDNISAVIDAGATRVAVSSAICGRDDPGQATRDLLTHLRAIESAS